MDLDIVKRIGVGTANTDAPGCTDGAYDPGQLDIHFRLQVDHGFKELVAIARQHDIQVEDGWLLLNHGEVKNGLPGTLQVIAVSVGDGQVDDAPVQVAGQPPEYMAALTKWPLPQREYKEQAPGLRLLGRKDHFPGGRLDDTQGLV